MGYCYYLNLQILQAHCWMFCPSLIVLFGAEVETIGNGATPEEVGHWGASLEPLYCFHPFCSFHSASWLWQGNSFCHLFLPWWYPSPLQKQLSRMSVDWNLWDESKRVLPFLLFISDILSWWWKEAIMHRKLLSEKWGCCCDYLTVWFRSVWNCFCGRD